MLGTNSDKKDATVIDLFSQMNEAGVGYAVLRNYDLYPSFGHDIDLVVRWSDLPRLIAMAKSCAESHGWSVLSRCDHWDRSPSREHTIQILRFYSETPLEFLQIDVFHSQLVLGVPLFNEDALLCDRFKDNRGFVRIDERVENLCRLLSIAKMAEHKTSTTKIARYREHALSFWDKERGRSAFAENLGFPTMSTALDHLRSGDILSFKREVDRQKRAWWIRQLCSHPLRSGKLVFDRALDYLRLFWLRPCGFDVRVFASDEGQRKRLEQIMRRIAETNIITHFTLDDDFKQRRTVRERGGVAIVWTAVESADVIVDSLADEESVIRALVLRLIERHPRLLDQRIVTN